MVVAEGLAEALALQILAQGHVAVAQGGHAAGRRAIEAQDLLQHRPEARAEQVATLGEQGGRRIFEPAQIQGHGEGHVGGPRLKPQMGEQGDQVRIGGVVEDDEAGVHRRLSGRGADVHGVGMAPQAVVALVDRHVVALRQQPGAGQGGDPRAHDGDPQARTGLAGRGRQGHKDSEGGLQVAKIRAAHAAGSRNDPDFRQNRTRFHGWTGFNASADSATRDGYGRRA